MKKVLFVLLAALTACTSPMTTTPSPSPASTTSTNSVEVWLTFGDQSKKLSREADVHFQAGENSGIVIDDAKRYQQMEGFGAAMTDSSAWLIMNKLDEAAREKVMRDLFTREGNGIGLSYVRIPMGASDFALKDYTFDDMQRGQADPELRRFNIEYDKPYIIPALKMASELNPQLRFMGSPWSAPAWMKKPKQLHGSSLAPEYYQAFADYHVRFVQT